MCSCVQIHSEASLACTDARTHACTNTQTHKRTYACAHTHTSIGDLGVEQGVYDRALTLDDEMEYWVCA